MLQSCRLQPELTVRETLEMYAGYYPIAATGRRRRSSSSGSARRPTSAPAGSPAASSAASTSALALIGDPELLFLDEPTTGFDPSARRQAWDMIAGLRDLGKTIFLTTHYMEEAQGLADRVAIIAGGEIVAEGAPSELGGRERAGDRDPLPASRRRRRASCRWRSPATRGRRRRWSRCAARSRSRRSTR